MSRVAVVQFDDRPLPKLWLMTLLMQRNKAYAARHGYDYHFIAAAEADLPVYWLKPHICGRLLSEGYDIVVWLDTDAVVHDLNRRVEPFFEGVEVMVGAGDNPYWASPFNAGVFFIRGEGGADLIARWMALFSATGWRRTETAWVCDDEWAGPSFEQGAFNLHLLDGALATGQLRLIDWRVLQSPFPVEGVFTLHFAGHFKANLPVYLSLL